MLSKVSHQLPANCLTSVVSQITGAWFLMPSFQAESLPGAEQLLSPEVLSIYDMKITNLDLHTAGLCDMEGMKPLSTWRARTHTRYPGLVFIANPFTAVGQAYWVKRCLGDYPTKPSLCNLDAHVHLSDDDNIFHMSRSVIEDNPSGDKSKEKSLLDRLRWVTLGYHHDWDTKKYSADKHSPMPLDLACLCRYIARTIHYQDFTAQAAIINYYHMDSTLAPHTDHSELDHHAPLISVSFGPSAIFLLGGQSKSEAPTAFYLRSGDVCIMSQQCRLSYHAVPRILPFPDDIVPRILPFPNKVVPQGLPPTQLHTCHSAESTFPNELSNTNTEAHPTDASKALVQELISINMIIHECIQRTDFSAYVDYVKSSRINMNVRQVLEPGQHFPCDS